MAKIKIMTKTIYGSLDWEIKQEIEEQIEKGWKLISTVPVTKVESGFLGIGTHSHSKTILIFKKEV